MDAWSFSRYEEQRRVEPRIEKNDWHLRAIGIQVFERTSLPMEEKRTETHTTYIFSILEGYVRKYYAHLKSHIMHPCELF